MGSGNERSAFDADDALDLRDATQVADDLRQMLAVFHLNGEMDRYGG